MKVLFVANGKIFTDVEINRINEKQLSGVKRITGSSFMFNVAESASVLADLQHFCHSQQISYNLYYFSEDPVMYTSP